MANIDRRKFLKQSSEMAGSAAAAFTALQCATPVAGDVTPQQTHAPRTEGYGILQPAGDDWRLPPGFQYKKIGEVGSLMSDGLSTPPSHDGSAAFPLPNGNIRLIRNHEIGRRPADVPLLENAYDSLVGGGTTSMEIDPRSREVIRDFVSLSGTAVNCAGGPTPWGSWLSCEEITAGLAAGAQQPHGYVFEVPVSAEEPVVAVPLKAMGRFVHEAAAVDPATGIVYETEDYQPHAGFYRFLPSNPYREGQQGDLSAGGRLQMLGIWDQPEYDASTGQTVGESLPVTWIDIADPDPPNAEEQPDAVYQQGRVAGGTKLTRVEGCWYGDGKIFFSCTDGGDAGRGQIWSFLPAGDGGELTLLYESLSQEYLDRPDNICVSPQNAVLICEDGDFRQFIRVLTRDGELFEFAENIANGSEITGATFSPDGNTLFVNIQRPGATYAIWGPWQDGSI